MRRAARVDGNQADIVDALRRVGVQVEVIGKPLDLLCCDVRTKRTFLMECKDPRPTTEGGRHGITKEQAEFIARWPGEYHVVENVQQALVAALGAKAMA